MSLGLSMYHSAGEFSPRVEFNAKSGRLTKVDRHPDGTSTTRLDLTMFAPVYAFDFGSVEIGWLHFQEHMAPAFSMVPFGNQMPPRPDVNFKAGFRLKLWDGREQISREFSSCAGATVGAIEALWGQFTAAPEAAAGKIPVLRFGNVVPCGRNYAPVLELVQWFERRDDIFGARTVAAPGAAPIPHNPAAAGPPPFVALAAPQPTTVQPSAFDMPPAAVVQRSAFSDTHVAPMQPSAFGAAA